MNRNATLTLGALALLFAGCSSSTTLRVVDIDAGYRPISGATISRIPQPRRMSDPWTTTPADVKQTDADGKATFGNGYGRFIVSAPGHASVMYYSNFPKALVELGVGKDASGK